LTSPAAWQEWPVAEKIRLRMALRRRRRLAELREDQRAPKGDWQKLLLTGGRGSGKSRAGADAFAEEILSDPERSRGEWAIVAPTFADARDKCVESEESGLLVALGTSKPEVDAGVSPVVKTWNRSIGELELHDGTKVYIDGADDGAYRIQGYNLRGVWADEVGLWKKWQAAWDESITFALRLGRSRVIATGTPKRAMPARRLLRRLIDEAKTSPKTIHRRLRTADNWQNLSAAFREAVGRYQGTTLGAQELEGVLLENAEGALWQLDWIEQTRVESLPRNHFWQRPPVIGVDPADGAEDGAEHAYAVAGLSSDHDLYVVESEGVRGSPTDFARRVVLVAHGHKGVIVVEKNHGGQWLVDVFRRAMKDIGVNVPLKVVSASQGKLTRAEPIAALYEPRKLETGIVPGRVHHLGYFEALEDQLVNFTGASGETSPDRLDALVWALSEFTRTSFGPPLPDHLDSAVPYKDETIGTDEYGELEGAVAWR
jgi:phage terminase large subunit-like protein